MSYPPYNPYGQEMYPPPEHATAALSYPIYPGSAAPVSMPMPSSGPSPYPPQQSPYPSQPSQYPPQPSHYPSQQSPYPSQQSPYPAHQSSYPPQPSAYPHQQSAYPSLQSAYPLQQSTYTPQQSAYPPKQPSPQPNHGPNNGGNYMHGGGAPFSYSNPSNNITGQQHSMKKSTPTVVPANPFNPRQDAEILRKAMKGFGTDEKAIINVLTARTNSQRQEIAVQFKTLYGKDLIKDLKSELSGNFEDLIVTLMTPTPYFLAKEVSDAISGVGTDEETLIEILCTSTNNDIRILRSEYERSFGVPLDDALASDTSGSFRRLLVSLCQAGRDESYMVNQAAAQGDAQALLRAGELRLGTDESTFNAILCSRSYPQLRQVFIEYRNLTGNDFKDAVNNEFSGDIQDGLLAIVKSVEDRAAYFAERLYKSMKGFGTKDRTLQRIVALRCEIDMGDIKQSFVAKYGISLEDFIKDDCSGDYKKTLVALVS